MPNKLAKKPRLPSRDALCKALADKLDDTVLTELFPGCDTLELRQLLASTVKTAKIATEAGKPEASQNAAQTQAPPGWCRLFTDGASRGNPGHAGAGAVLYKEDGEELRWSSYLGICTNNVAEYRALLLGLQEACNRGCTHVALFLDAELVVRQLQGHYKVKHEHLQPLYREVCHLLKSLADWSVAHVPRSSNTVADSLANEGIDQARAKTAADHGSEKNTNF